MFRPPPGIDVKKGFVYLATEFTPASVDFGL
jgi:hypothetical protein